MVTCSKSSSNEPRAGDHEAFSILVRRSFPRLRGIASLILRDQDRAQDAVQEALVLAWRHIRAVRDPDAWDAWLYRTTVRACYRLARTEKRRDLVELHVEPDPESPGAHDFASSVVDRDLLGRELGRLPIDQRAVMVLHFYLDLPLTEVAGILDIPVGTAKSRLHRGLEALRSTMGADPIPTRRPRLGAVPMNTNDTLRADGHRPSGQRRRRVRLRPRAGRRSRFDEPDAAISALARPDLKEPPMRIPSRVVVGSPTFRLATILALTLALARGRCRGRGRGCITAAQRAPRLAPFGPAATGPWCTPRTATSTSPTPTAPTHARSSPAKPMLGTHGSRRTARGSPVRAWCRGRLRRRWSPTRTVATSDPRSRTREWNADFMPGDSTMVATRTVD